MPVKSKAQFRFAKANRDKMGEEWTEDVDYDELPEKVKQRKRQVMGDKKKKKKKDKDKDKGKKKEKK